MRGKGREGGEEGENPIKKIELKIFEKKLKLNHSKVHNFFC